MGPFLEKVPERLDGCEKVVVGFVGVVFDELKVELKGRYDISK